MRTALSIFRRDIRRIMRSPVAVIVTVGVCIIPSLYAWINILANWDPYANTSTMPVAVVIEDEGAQVPAWATSMQAIWCATALPRTTSSLGRSWTTSKPRSMRARGHVLCCVRDTE